MNFVMYRMVCSLIITQMLASTCGQTYKEMDTLIGYLFNGSRYNKFLRPLQDQSQVMKVNFTQYLNSVEYFDIVSGELLITGFFEITWIDELLTWDPSLYGGKEMISLPKGKFWKPEFILTNGPANDEFSIYNSDFSPAWATYQGSVIMLPAGNYKTRCNVDTTLYPLDIHKCNFQFIVSNHDSTELMVNSPKGDINTGNFTENGEWEIKHTDAKVVLLNEENIGEISIPMLQASFSLKRRPIFELINIYAPITLMSLLNIVTSFVRPDSGERLSFAVTLYLSLMFTTTAAIERIPNNSLKMPFMSYEVLSINFINTVGVAWSIFIVHIASKSIIEQRLPVVIMKMVINNRKRQTIKPKLRHDGKSEVTTEPLEDEDFLEENKAKLGQEKTAKCVPVNDITGLEVAGILDTIYFWFVSLFILVLHAIYIFGALMFSTWTQS